jgi:hypothetical protein
MSPNSCWLAARGCAISWSTKVRAGPERALEPTPLTQHHPSPDSKIVYRRYASLFFIAGSNSDDNELITLEIVHRYVEQMDKYYGNVCELDIIFNFQKAYFILDELLLAGEMQESSKKNVLRVISAQDQIEDTEVSLRSSWFPSCAGVVRLSASVSRETPTWGTPPKFFPADEHTPCARSMKKSRGSCNIRSASLVFTVLGFLGLRRIGNISLVHQRFLLRLLLI